MRVSGSRVYAMSAPVPKMPPGLVELMEGLTRDVLKNNPSNVYEFCANHLQTLLEKRDGKSYSKVLSLEQKIKIAQKIVKQRAEKRWKKISKDLQINYEYNDNQTIHENSLISENEKILKPAHHDCDFTNASEIEISCGPGDTSIITGENVFEKTQENESNEMIQNIKEIESNPGKQIENIDEDYKETHVVLNNETVALVEIKEENVSLIRQSNEQPHQSDNNDIISEIFNDNTKLERQPPDESLNKCEDLNTEDIIIDSKDVYDDLIMPVSNVIDIHVHAPEEVMDKGSGEVVITTMLNSNLENVNQSASEDVNSGLTIKENEIKVNQTDNASIDMPESKVIDPTGISSNGLKVDPIEININKIVDHTPDKIHEKDNVIEVKVDVDYDKLEKNYDIQSQREEEKHPHFTNENETGLINSNTMLSVPDLNTDKLKDNIQKVDSDENTDETITLQDSLFDNNQIANKDVSLESNKIDKDSMNSQVLETNHKDEPTSVYTEEESTDNKDNEFKNYTDNTDDSTTNILNVTPSNSLDVTNDHSQPVIPLYKEEIEENIINKRNVKDLENSQDTADEVFIKVGENTDESTSTIEGVVKCHSDALTLNDSANTMDLETAAVTIQKVFRTFLFKSRASTFDDSTNDDHLPYEDNDEDKKDEELFLSSSNKDRRLLGITRMDTVLQTVNEEKSLSLSTDDSSLSSAATIIQAHVRGFLVRNKLNSAKTASSNNSLLISNGVSTISVEGDEEQYKNKTVLNIHIVPEGNFLSRDESMVTSMDLSLDGSPPSSVNLHPLGYDKTNERRKQLKREDAVQSISPPSNNSGKLSEDVESVKELPVNDTEKANASLEQDTATAILLKDSSQDTDAGSIETTPTNSVTIDTVIEDHTGNTDMYSSPEHFESSNKSKKSITKQSSDEMDVITPFKEISATKDTVPTQKLLHSGEFHDTVLPTKVSRSDTTVVSEFKNVLVYFLLWNN